MGADDHILDSIEDEPIGDEMYMCSVCSDEVSNNENTECDSCIELFIQNNSQYFKIHGMLSDLVKK